MITEPTAGEHGWARKEEDQEQRSVAHSTQKRGTQPLALVKEVLHCSFPGVGVLTVRQCLVWMTPLAERLSQFSPIYIQ